MTAPLSRRQMFQAATAACAASLVRLPESEARAAERPADEPFGYMFNTSTIRGCKIDGKPPTAVDEVEIAAKAGYHAIEPWINRLDEHVKSGGSLKDLGKRIADHGMTVESSIGFARWIVDDDAERAKGLEEAKRNMAMLQELGGKRIAAPPVGATKEPMDLWKVVERYGKLLELGEKMGIVPELEVWGFSKTLSRLGETVLVAVEAGHPQSCILPDVYHIYKGGSDFNGFKLLSGASMHAFHVNDYPDTPARDKINDADRVYPGDGVAPLDFIFRTIYANGFRGYLSLELFNRDYWSQDPLTVAKTGLEKTRAAVKKAFG